MKLTTCIKFGALATGGASLLDENPKHSYEINQSINCVACDGALSCLLALKWAPFRLDFVMIQMPDYLSTYLPILRGNCVSFRKLDFSLFLRPSLKYTVIL